MIRTLHIPESVAASLAQCFAEGEHNGALDACMSHKSRLAYGEEASNAYAREYARGYRSGQAAEELRVYQAQLSGG
jgi:hypothetical protein